MKLTKRQREDLIAKAMGSEDAKSNDLQESFSWWIENLENLEPDSKEEICFSCGGTGIYKYNTVDLEPKYGAQERQEKECEHKSKGFLTNNFETVTFCSDCNKTLKVAEVKPERIEELGWIAENYPAKMYDKINEIIRKLNTL